ncbi:MAG: hypothetical protein HYY02_10285 [Chloroflexi bacterium]|nr:hypothetical protein [Chloroflexota bacterium]
MAKSKFINPLFLPTVTQEAPTAPPAAPGTAPAEAQPQSAAAPAAPGSRAMARPGARGAAATARSQAAPAVPEAPVKFTFYFTPEQLRRLDDLWVRAKLDHRQRLNKSEFVRLALERLLDEFEHNPRRVLEALRRQRSTS